MSCTITLSDEARRTIEEQLEWYEADVKHGGAELADRWLDRLESALHKLAMSPHRYGLAPENGRWHPELEIRQMQFRPWKSGVGWRVLFVLDEKQRIVTVLQVRHERRRWLFDKEEDE
jgi:plasmid stabilization system protein ParE